ncbi:MAG: hypothetical protein ACOX02_04130 [Acholeplasmatales bacterium]
MASTIISKYKYYKKKRNLLLFFAYLPLIIGIPLFSYLFILGNKDIALTLLLVFVLIYLGLILYLRAQIYAYVMYLKYFEMLINKMPPQKIKRKLFTEKWLEKIQKDYELRKDTKDYELFSKYIKRDSFLSYIKNTSVIIVLAKHEGVDFYSPDIEHETARIVGENKVRQSVVLQFKRYRAFSEEAMESIEQVINYKDGFQHVIHITIGYVDTINEIYFLHPKKKYPNKFYYYGTTLIKRLCEED